MKEYKRKHTIIAIRSRKTRRHNNKADGEIADRLIAFIEDVLVCLQDIVGG